jgi:hypothetical protein
VQLIGPLTFCVWPSMTTRFPTGAAALLPLLLEPVLDLSLEQPASPATTVAAAAIPINVTRCATGLLRLIGIEYRRHAVNSRCTTSAHHRSRQYALEL